MFPSDYPAPDQFWDNKSSLTKHGDTYPFIDPYRFKNALRGRVVVIMLAHRGVGRSSAVAFAAAGASVVMIGPTAQSLEQVHREIKEKYGTPTLALTADLLDVSAPARIVLLVERHLGPIDILINITAPAYFRPFAHEPDIMTDWWPVLERNVRAPIALIRAVLPSMMARRTGIIISTTLVTGAINAPFLSANGVSSAALLKFHHQLDQEMRPKGIMSFAVHPGLIPSHLHDPDNQFVTRPEDFEKEPRMQTDLTDIARIIEWDHAGLASGTFVALCADPRARVLSGMYVNAGRDLGELIVEMESDPGRAEREKLYVLKVDEL